MRHRRIDFQIPNRFFGIPTKTSQQEAACAAFTNWQRDRNPPPQNSFLTNLPPTTSFLTTEAKHRLYSLPAQTALIANLAMTMKRPLILLLGISSTTAYSTSMSPSLDVVSFAQTLRVASTSTIMEQNRSLLESRMSKPYKVSYDLGIGRNLPFVSKGQQGEAQRERKSRDQSVFHHATVEFWNEHQAVRDLPDPSRRTPSVKAARKGSKVKPIVPNRLAIDALAIMEYDEYLGETKASGSSSFSRAQNRPHPIMTVAGSFSVRNLDVNTPWVEMLIHEQQQKLKLQAS